MAWHKIHVSGGGVHLNIEELLLNLQQTTDFLYLNLKTRYQHVHRVNENVMVRSSDGHLLDYELGPVLTAFMRLNSFHFNWNRRKVK